MERNTDNCIIVASGPSALGFIPPEGIDIIGVNGVADWITRLTTWFTCDPTYANMKRLKNKREETHYVLATNNPAKYDHLVKDVETIYLMRDPIFMRSDTGKYHRVIMNADQTWYQYPYINALRGVINSGFGAIQLAVEMGYKTALLIGFDGTDEERVEGGKSGSLNLLPKMVSHASSHIQLYNAGKLQCPDIKSMTVDEYMEMINE